MVSEVKIRGMQESKNIDYAKQHHTPHCWLVAKVMYPANSTKRFSWLTRSTPIFIVEERSDIYALHINTKCLSKQHQLSMINSRGNKHSLIMFHFIEAQLYERLFQAPPSVTELLSCQHFILSRFLVRFYGAYFLELLVQNILLY